MAAGGAGKPRCCLEFGKRAIGCAAIQDVIESVGKFQVGPANECPHFGGILGIPAQGR